MAARVRSSSATTSPTRPAFAAVAELGGAGILVGDPRGDGSATVCRTWPGRLRGSKLTGGARMKRLARPLAHRQLSGQRADRPRRRFVWGCVPRVDGDPVFSALLNDAPTTTRAVCGRSISSTGVSTEQRYCRNTPILDHAPYRRCRQRHRGDRLLPARATVAPIAPTGRSRLSGSSVRSRAVRASASRLRPDAGFGVAGRADVRLQSHPLSR